MTIKRYTSIIEIETDVTDKSNRRDFIANIEREVNLARLEIINAIVNDYDDRNPDRVIEAINEGAADPSSKTLQWPPPAIRTESSTSEPH